MDSHPKTETKDILKLLELFENTYNSNYNEKIKSAENKLNKKLMEQKQSVMLLFKILSLNKILDNEIPLNQHKSVIIYLKNMLIKDIHKIGAEDILSYINNFLELLCIHHKTNKNLKHPIMLNIMQSIINNLLSQKQIFQNRIYINNIFQTIYYNLNNSSKEDFLYMSKVVIILCNSLLSSKSADKKNYDVLIDKYYIPIINIIFKNVNNFLDPKNNKYNNEFIKILIILFDGFYTNLSRMKNFYDNEKRKNIVFKFFKEYGIYSLELFQLNIPLDEKNKKIFGTQNPLICFSVEEENCFVINNLKSKILQFLSYVIQVSNLDEKNNINLNDKNCVGDKELIDIINKIIILIVNSFEDVLNNQEKFILVRKMTLDIGEEDDVYNNLFFQFFAFLSRGLVREPIKSQFSEHIKKFLLNILFPILVTFDEEEKKLLELDPNEYHIYIDDLIFLFKFKNLRTSGCFLIKRICEKYEDMINFTLSFCLEMFNYIINGGKTDNKLTEYNIYLKNIDNCFFNKFNDKAKIDFSLLVILILKEYIIKNEYFKNIFRKILIINQEKMHLITCPLIHIKICRIYYYFLPILFQEKNGNKNNTPEEIKIKFLENSINYLLNTIVQKGYGEEYVQGLVNEASDTIIELLNLPKNSINNEYECLIKYLEIKLESYLHKFNQLIEYIDLLSFYLILKDIIKNIKIENRDLLFECLKNLTKKFRNDFLEREYLLKEKTDNNNVITDGLFPEIYFETIIDFLKGINKINSSDKNEIKQFDEFFEEIIKEVQVQNNPRYHEEILRVTQEYIKILNGINHLSAIVLKNIIDFLDQEKYTSISCFEFVSTFLSFIQTNISDKPLDQTELFNDILKIIKQCYNFNDEYYLSSKLYGLLLTLQILNLNPNLNEKTLSFLLNSSLDCYKIADPNEQIDENNEDFEIDSIPELEQNNINQLSLANISLGFIYKPELTFKILINKYDIILENNNFEKYIQLIQYIPKIPHSHYATQLGKCIILGLCAIFGNKNCLDYLNNNKKAKIYLIKLLIVFMIRHKNEKNSTLKRLMKGELKINFVSEKENENEEEEEKEEEEEEDIENLNEDLNETVDNILNGNNNIIMNCDEFKFFTEVMKYIKDHDNQIYEILIQDNNFKEIFKNIDEIYKIRNIKIKYNDKEFTVPRRTVKIIRDETNKNQ